MASNKSFHKKLISLFRGKRTFPQRLLLAIPPALALSFTLFFFGPLDLSVISRDYLNWSPLDILSLTTGICGAVFVILLLAAAIPGGKIHAFLVSLYSGISLAMYLQANFFNPDLGTLDGRTINWPGQSKSMMIGLVIWFVILLAPHLLHYFSNRVWRGFVTLLSLALLIMQGVSLTLKLMDQQKIDQSRQETFYLSNENMFRVGAKNNIIVFLLDTVSNRDIELMKEKYPDALNAFRDFTRFDNANSRYMFTVPSLVSLLTESEWTCENESIRDYMNNAWRGSNAETFYQSLKSEGYERNFYLLLPEAANDPAVLRDAVSNLKTSTQRGSVDRQALLKLYKLSFYRYFPLALKPFFVIYTTDIANLISTPDALVSEWDFVKSFSESEISAGNSDNVFSFYYLAGTHKPYRIDERGRMIHSDLAPEFLTDYSDMETQLAGFFYLIADYMRQLKELNLYDQTGIIILADHGNNAEKDADHQPVYFVKMPGERQDQMKVSSAPVTIQEVFLPDILSMADAENAMVGQPSIEYSEEPRERRSRIYGWDEAYPALAGSSYNVMLEYSYTGDGDDLTEQWLNGNAKSIPMLDCYY